MTPTTRALVAAARAGLDPDPGAAERVRARLNLALGGAAAATPVAATSSGLAMKLVVAIAILGGAGALAIPSHAARATAVPAPMFDDVIAADFAPIRVVVTTREPAAPAAAPSPPRARAAAVPPAAPVAAPATEISLAREVELIDHAMASLRAGHPDDALTAIASYHRETADRGQLTEEAAAIDIEASCELHLAVGEKLATFDRTWPSSAQRSRLTTACKR